MRSVVTNIFNKKALVTCVREYPLAYPCLSLLVSQLVLWYLPELLLPCLSLVFLGIVYLAIRGVRLSKSLFGMCLLSLLVAIISLAPLCRQMFTYKYSWQDHILLAKVVAPIRFPRPGSFRVSLKVKAILTSDHESDLRYQAFSKPQYMLCDAVALPWKNIYQAKKGDLLSIRADIKSITYDRNPFSYNARLVRHGYHAKCKLKFVAILKPGTATLRKRTIAKLQTNLKPGDASAVILAMLFGYKDLLSSYTTRIFRNLGIAHLLVVSGFHIGALYLFIRSLLVCTFKLLINRLYTLPVLTIIESAAFATSLFYVFISGASSSSVRAIITLVCLLISKYLGRGKSSLFSGIYLALIVLSLYWPVCVAEPGVQLSFAALFAIALAQRREAALTGWWRLFVYPGIATGLITLIWFGYFPLVSFIFNCTLVPILVLLVCKGGFLAILLHFSGIDRSALMLEVVRFLTEIFLTFVTEISEFFRWTQNLSESYYYFFLVFLVVLIVKGIYHGYGTFLRQYNVLKP